MASVSFVNQVGLKNTFNAGSGLWEEWISPVVLVPANITRPGYVTVIVSAGNSPQNIYNLGVYIECSNDGGQTWWVQDSSESFRGPAQANTSINLSGKARIESLAGKRVRVRVKLGGSTCSVSAAFSEV